MDQKKVTFQIKNLLLKKQRLELQLSDSITKKSAELTAYNQQNCSISINQRQSIQDNSNTTTISSLDENQVIYNTLLSEKSALQIKLKTVKQKIVELNSEKSSLIIKQKELPLLKTNQLNNEKQIQTDEITRIKETYKIINDKYLALIYNEYDNKNILRMQIDELTNKIVEQSKTLQTLQVETHCFRKQTIIDLQVKKQKKQETKLLIDKNDELIHFVNDKIKDLESRLTMFQNLKSNIINKNPNPLQISMDCAQLHINDISTLDINSQTTTLDTHINQVKTTLHQHNIKLNRLKTELHNLSSPEKMYGIANSGRTIFSSNNNNNNNNNSNNNVCLDLSFKELLKLEKANLQDIESRISSLKSSYDSFDTSVIGGHVKKYVNDIEVLYMDYDNSIKRLSIMHDRINEDIDNKNELLCCNIRDCADKIADLKIELDTISIKISSLDTQVSENFKSLEILNELNDKIANTNKQLDQINSDIEKLTKLVN